MNAVEPRIPLTPRASGFFLNLCDCSLSRLIVIFPGYNRGLGRRGNENSGLVFLHCIGNSLHGGSLGLEVFLEFLLELY